MSNNGFERKLMPNGRENPKYIDLLDEDKPLSGQKFVCVSFVSPENILKRKELEFFKEFLKHFDFSKSVNKFTQFLNFYSYKFNLNFENVMKDFQEYVQSEKDSFSYENVLDEYKNFLDANEDRLEAEFNKNNDFQTSTRGLKIRGSFETQEEAELRCKMLREVDPNHNVYVGPVGMWMPWEPEAYKTGKVEYLEEELNQLMKEKNNSESYAKKQFEERILNKKKEAIENNKKIARETGNKLTQNIDEDGNLIGVNNTIENNILSNNSEEVSVRDVQKELFEGGLKKGEEFSKMEDKEKFYNEKFYNKVEESVENVVDNEDVDTDDK